MNIRAFVRRHAVATYFVVAFAISWVGAFAVVGPQFLRGEPVPETTLMLMGLPILAGPSIAGIALTYVVEGTVGLRKLFSRMGRWRVDARWYAAALLIFPVLTLAGLLALAVVVSPAFRPGFFALGIVLGLMAGFIEEIGWMGFAFPRMESTLGTWKATLYLGLLHGLWHIVGDYLGASTASGGYWFPRFFAMWGIGMTAMRIILVWIYKNSGSLLLAQLTHASSTGFLLVFGPSPISPANETLWFAMHAVVLWVAAAVVLARYGKGLVRSPT